MALTSAAIATPLDFTFSMENDTTTMTGLIEGLASDGLGRAASSITVAGVFGTIVFDAADLKDSSFDVGDSSKRRKKRAASN
ncbi:MAG: hypothetical protein AAFN59_05040 [Pseudomonadota bacterium]